jgi:lysophospholipase L1-like esterase
MATKHRTLLPSIAPGKLMSLIPWSTTIWIRTSKAFDEVIDFDVVMRDPDHPSRLLPRLASEDHLHPNDDGYQRMASAIDLSLFR